MDGGRLTQSMLLDFYGELLTEKQRECFDLHYNEDLSLAEIAEQLGVTRQGVWDNIRRAQAAMEDVEKKTGLIGRFQENRDSLLRLKELLSELVPATEGRARELSERAEKEVGAMILRG